MASDLAFSVEKLFKLKKDGALTEQEFKDAKSKYFKNPGTGAAAAPTPAAAPDAVSSAVTQLALDFQSSNYSNLVAKFPSVANYSNLKKLELHIKGEGAMKLSVPEWAKWIDPIKECKGLEHLDFQIYERYPPLRNELVDTMASWPAGGMQLKTLIMDGAMYPTEANYINFINKNNILSPDLDKFCAADHIAHPGNMTDTVFLALTKRYRKMSDITIGSCVNMTDDAFKYFTDNEEGIQAGLKVFTLYLVCPTQIHGKTWLDTANVKKNLPSFNLLHVKGRWDQGRDELGARLVSECDGVGFMHRCKNW